MTGTPQSDDQRSHPMGRMAEIRADVSDESPYEFYVDGNRAGFMDYQLRGDTFIAMHTEVDDAYEGQGLGSQLVTEVLDDVRDAGMALRPSCPFVRASSSGIPSTPIS